jgi:hypothetical protein
LPAPQVQEAARRHAQARPADYTGPADVEVAQRVLPDQLQLELTVSWEASFTADEGPRWVAAHRCMAAALAERLAELGVPAAAQTAGGRARAS